MEVVPSEDANDAFAVHKHLLTENGILIHENLNLGTLADDEVYEFAYIFVRVPFKGGTGSPAAPSLSNSGKRTRSQQPWFG